jgi:hypothetical protein
VARLLRDDEYTKSRSRTDEEMEEEEEVYLTSGRREEEYKALALAFGSSRLNEDRTVLCRVDE